MPGTALGTEGGAMNKSDGSPGFVGFAESEYPGCYDKTGAETVRTTDKPSKRGST